MNQIIAQAQRGKTCLISLQVRGRQMRQIIGPGGVATWCEPEHRPELGRALEDCRTLGKRLTKAGLGQAILQIKPNAVGIGKTKDERETYLSCLLIELWFPFHDVQ